MTYVDIPKISTVPKNRDSYRAFSENKLSHKIPQEKVSISTLLNRSGFGGFQFFMSLCCGTFFCAESCELVMLSLALPELKKEWNLSNFEESMIGSIVFLGMFLGSIFWGYISDMYGRKFGIVLCSFTLSVFGFLRVLCFDYYTFNICGFVIGFSIGGCVIPFSLYLEFLPTRLRGVNYLLIELYWVFGTCFIVATGWVVLTKGMIFQKYNLRIFLLISKIPAIVSFFLSLIEPESMNYLAICRDEKKIKKTLNTIRFFNCRKKISIDDYKIDYGCSKETSKKKKGRVLDLLSRDLFFPFVCICIFYVCGSLSYYGVVMSSPNFFSEGKNEMYFGNLVFAVSELFGIIIPAVFLWLWGRKFVQMICFFVCGLSLLVLCLVQSSGLLTIIVGVFARSTVMGASSVTWVLAQESLPTNVRSVGCGIACGMGKIGTIFAPLISTMLPFEHELFPKIIFAILSIGAGMLCMVYPLETKGKELKDFISEKKRNKVEIEIVEMECLLLEDKPKN